MQLVSQLLVMSQRAVMPKLNLVGENNQSKGVFFLSLPVQTAVFLFPSKQEEGATQHQFLAG